MDQGLAASRESLPLAHPRHEKTREFREVREPRPPWRECCDGKVPATQRMLPRVVETEHGGIGRLHAVGVGARTFPERRRRAFDIEDVVLDLEGETDLGAELRERGTLRSIRDPGRYRTEQ